MIIIFKCFKSLDLAKILFPLLPHTSWVLAKSVSDKIEKLPSFVDCYFKNQTFWIKSNCWIDASWIF
jgi:hypothetical protein